MMMQVWFQFDDKTTGQKAIIADLSRCLPAVL